MYVRKAVLSRMYDCHVWGEYSLLHSKSVARPNGGARNRTEVRGNPLNRKDPRLLIDHNGSLKGTAKGSKCRIKLTI